MWFEFQQTDINSPWCLQSPHISQIPPSILLNPHFHSTSQWPFIQTHWNHSIKKPSQLSEILFHFLFSLTNLNSNQLISLPPDIFYNNINLKYLSILISFHSSSHSHFLHSLSYNRLTSLPNGVFSQLTSLSSLPSSLPSIFISLPHLLCNLNSNSLTHIDMGNTTPSWLFVSIIPPHIIIIHLTLVTLNQTILSHSIMMIMSSKTTHSRWTCLLISPQSI